MTDEHHEALEAFLRAFDKRLETAPVVDRRKARAEAIVEARRSAGPIRRDFAYWVSPKGGDAA